MGNPTESTYRRLFTIAKYIRLYHNSKIYQNEYNNISKYQTISLYQNISASKINITIMGTISEIYHVSCEWVKNREAEVHMHAIIEGHADQNQRSTDKREGNLNYKEGTGKTLRKSFIC